MNPTLPPPEPLITQSIFEQVRDLVYDAYFDVLMNIEVQREDDGRLLLVSLGVAGDMTVREALRVLEIVSAGVSRLMPKRDDAYSWMVAIKYGDEVLRSACGGWIDRPDV